MNNSNNNLVDFPQLLNILISGIWIILTFSVTGLLIGYIYKTNFEFYEGEVQYKMTLPIYELGTVDKLKLNELNHNIKKLYTVYYEKLLLTQTALSPTIDIFAQKGAFTESIDVTSRELMKMIFHVTNKENFMKRVIEKYHSLIESKYFGNEEKINIYKINDFPSVIGEIQEIGNIQKYHFTVMFSGPYLKDGAELFANTILQDLRYNINQQLNHRFVIAKENYYQEVESIQKIIYFLMNNLENDFRVSLESKIEDLIFQRKVAFDLGYELPVTTDVILTEDSFAKGYIYLDKRIRDLEGKLNENFVNFVPELRSYHYASLELSQHVTLHKVEQIIKQLGLFDNTFKVFDTPLLNELIFQGSSDSSSHLVIDKTQEDNIYATMFGTLIGLFFGIFLTFVIYFYKNRNRA